mmetsp:Transcript_16945/g.36652  ORF Transcript_16945/g.36652 Transcript_16945/m.36652 type:complete len:215 (-) Transcript_16945:484-1128(-)
MAPLQLLAVLLDDVPATGCRAGALGGVVGVAARAVPVTGDGLGVKGHLHVVLLAHPVHEVPGNPQVVAHVNAGAGADLVLPLGGQHLTVHTRDVDASSQTQPVVSLADIPADRHTSTSRAVVGALRSGVTALRPAQGPLGLGVEQGILLLNAEPGLMVLGLLHGLSACGTSVGGNGLHRGNAAIGVQPGWLIAVAHHQDVVTAPEGILENCARN